MKIVIVIPSITNYHTFLKETCLMLSKHGHSVHLITSKRHLNGSIDYNKDIHGTLHLVNIPRNFNLFRIITSIYSIYSLLRVIKPDLVHGHFFITLFLLSFCKLISPFKFISTLHGVNSLNINGLRKYIYLSVEVFSIKLLDHVFILNKSDELYLRNFSNNVILHKTYGIGCDINTFNKRNIDFQFASNLKFRYNLSGNEFLFVFVGRLVHFKGFALVVRSFNKHLKNFPDSKLLIIGDFDEIHSSGLDKKEYNAFLTNESIIKVGWVNNVQDYLSICNIMVFPSFREGFPVCIMEALSMGIPVITIDSRGCNELIDHNFNGLIVNADVNTITESMRVFTTNRQIYEKFVFNSLLNRKNYDRKLFTQHQYNIYTKILT